MQYSCVWPSWCGTPIWLTMCSWYLDSLCTRIVHLSGGGSLGGRVIHWGEWWQISSRAATAVEPDVDLGVHGGVVLRWAAGVVTAEVGDGSTRSEVRGGALEVDNDEHRCDVVAGCMFWFKSSPQSDFRFAAVTWVWTDFGLFFMIFLFPFFTLLTSAFKFL